MALKTTAAAALQHGHRRRLKPQALLPMAMTKRSVKLAARLAVVKRARLEERKQKKQKQEQEQKQEQKQKQEEQSTTTPSSTPASSSLEQEQQPLPLTMENKRALENIFGRYYDEDDRCAADVLATLHKTGLVKERDTGIATPADSPRHSVSYNGDDSKPFELALPTMHQTSIILDSWRSENGSTKANSEVDEYESASPMTPALSFSSSVSGRSSSVGSPEREVSPSVQYAHPSSPSGPPPPPYDTWRKSIALADLSLNQYQHQHQHQRQTSQQQPSPFATYEQSYFNKTRARDAVAPVVDGRNGMPSPPQSPTDAGWSTEHWYHNANKQTPTMTLPTPPQSFSASMQHTVSRPQQTPTFQSPHAAYQQSAQYSRHHQQYQYELPAPMPTRRRGSIGNSPGEDIATTVVTLPPPNLSRDLLTPVSPLTLPGAFGGRRSTTSAMSPMHYHHQHHLSPRMAAKMDSRKERLSASFSSSFSSAPSSAASSPTKKTSALPKPHCNVKYETAELDFIMYQRTTKNRAWDDVTASFNAALPRLRQYADMDYMRLGGASGAAANGADGLTSKAAMDRYRARPERTTPGLQASYYRQRLALPLLDASGQLVFDSATGKQMFTEVMVRDDKSRKKSMRRLTGGAAAASSSAGAASAAAGKFNPDDTRVHLVLYFPERVAYYDYWFVSEEDKALARQRAYERNMQRAQRGLPAWQPGSDDPETGILIRNKD